MDMKRIGAKIRCYRKANNMTQAELAELVHINASHISVIERGTKSPSLETFVSIANALGVSPDGLLKDVLDPKIQTEDHGIPIDISQLPPKEQQRIVDVVQTMISCY